MKKIYKFTDTLTDEVVYQTTGEFVEGKGIPSSAICSACKRGYLLRGRWKVELSEVTHRNGEAFDREIRDLICINYKNGMGQKDLANMFHTTVEHIRQIVVDAGIFEDRHKTVPLDQVRVVYPEREIYDKGKLGALYKAGWNTNKIADEFGTSEKKVIETLRSLGL